MKLQNLFFTATAVQSHRDARIQEQGSRDEDGRPGSETDQARPASPVQEDCGQCDMLGVVPEMYTPNPTYGAMATGATCTELARLDGKEYNIPDCMPWGIFDGKIIFRLASYEYTRSRAHQACQVTQYPSAIFGYRL